MVELASQPGASVARIAREHDINDNLLFKWLRLWQNEGRISGFHEAAGIAACLMTYSHHACRTECYAMTVHYYRLRDYALQHPECSAIMRIID
ncbi:antirestriction protein [Escherichia coli]|uniref:antirestriction protein n=1 Tax=Escherichia coli TaxID=562 RepID=UPI00207CCE9F|nr:antirestriction protein [Escherichia coli]